VITVARDANIRFDSTSGVTHKVIDADDIENFNLS